MTVLFCFEDGNVFFFKLCEVHTNQAKNGNKKAVLHYQLKIDKDKRYNLSLSQLSLLFKSNKRICGSIREKLVCTPVFIDINIDGEEKTAIKLIVEAK